ncbi:deoxyribodipyrimidine photo-lyase [Vibrio sonorensis]|uniref:deoxyribodipyrimidine photo-lyase n=1 Tax=Vibrio sonorensis TaxID=1004316 RepID=UPI0008DAD8CD|nr:deoxyribodipyrimidine photo-lyase [Vibrio sonorensis]
MNIVWFRRDLRCDDNPALADALRTEQPTIAVYIATPEQWKYHGMAPIQADLIYRRLFELQSELAELGVPLIYQQVGDFNSSAEWLMTLAVRTQAKTIYFNKEYELNEVVRDKQLKGLAERESVECKSFDDKCIFVPGSVVNGSGDYYKVFTPFKNACLKRLMTSGVQIEPLKVKQTNTPILDSEIEELSLDSPFDYIREPSKVYKAKRSEILGLLRTFVAEKASHYHLQRDYPFVDGTSQLSPYLAIGALSARQCVARLWYQKSVLNEGESIWLSELIWRDFYQHLLHFRPDLSRGKSFHPWGETLSWKSSKDHFERWKSGQTGYPIVDAAMRQLNATGWMHNRLRMIVASFLTKDLHIDWHLGESYFMSKLVDGDFAANNGGWQWCASTGCDGQPYFRIFNPTTQGERFDPTGDFVRHWVPELSSIAGKKVHNPSKHVNVKSLSYPEPIVDHSAERKLTLELYKLAKDNSE